jgi:hypothetical protein
MTRRVPIRFWRSAGLAGLLSLPCALTHGAQYTTADTFILDDTGFTSVAATGIVGAEVTGFGRTSTADYTVLWTNGTRSIVNLNPMGIDYSLAYGAAGTQQIGYGNGKPISCVALE